MISVQQAAADLAQRGVSIIYSALPERLIAPIVAELTTLSAAQQLRPAAIGRNANVYQTVRGDWICWIAAETATPAQQPYWHLIEMLQSGLNAELFLGLSAFEGHYAVYPPGACYHKHLDRFTDADERAISCVLYLNTDWRAEHAGALRLYLPDGTQDVAPTAGTLALFRSDSIAHEVLPALRERYSVTGWFRRRPLQSRR